MPWMAQQAPWLARMLDVDAPETQFQNAARQRNVPPARLQNFLEYARAHPQLTPAQ